MPRREDGVEGVSCARVSLWQARDRAKGGSTVAVDCADASGFPGERKRGGEVVGEASEKVGGVGYVD